MKPGLSTRQRTTLALTPALRQAIRLLQMSSLELRSEIREALECNYMLELAEPEPPPVDRDAPGDREEGSERETPAVAPDEGADRDDELHEAPDAAADAESFDEEWGGPADGGLRDYLQANAHRQVSLREHLEWQVRVSSLDARDTDIALELVDAIDDDGYLKNWEEVRDHLCSRPGVDASRVARVLEVIHGFEPNGVGARDIRECLRLQLAQSGAPAKRDALRLLDLPLEELARRDLAALARATGLDQESVDAALALITSLQPHPGRPWLATRMNYVEPDVVALRTNGQWRVTLNPAHIPRLRVNAYYRSLIRRADHSDDQRALRHHLQEARNLISGVTARNDTLLRVAERIVREQRAFLDYGEEAMRPLVLRTIAEPLGMHESTVSRATANKYMLTPRGLFELKYFFPSHVNTTLGGTCSAVAIQAMIRRLIAQERPRQPLSDAMLTARLRGEGIQVARRTVAKYREGLRIPPSSERRMMA
ncbi:MAG TPA: RNA polymerase factor sigma-54 [Nevskiaceae bacterium]